MRYLIGTGGTSVARLGDIEGIHPQIERPSFLTRIGSHVYSTSEVEQGLVVHLTHPEAGHTIGSGGSFPCHVSAHPDRGWLYVSNYGCGTVRAISVGDDGAFIGEVIDRTHEGSGPHSERQEGSHAHFSRVIGDFLVVADLGTDELRAYRLDEGRLVEEEVVLTPMPPGTGPRHFTRVGSDLYVAGELSGEIVALAWDEKNGRGTVRGVTNASAAPGIGDLAHIEEYERLLIVGVRATNSLSVIRADDLSLISEIPTTRGPRHHRVVGDSVVVAGLEADEVVWHPLDPGGTASGRVLGTVNRTEPVQIPMCILPIPEV